MGKRRKQINYQGKDYIVIGWREWVTLPSLGIQSIKAKIDTGARTSALHAFDIERFHHLGKEFVNFKVHPLQRNNKAIVMCNAQLIDKRWVTDSGGHRDLRYVIETAVLIGGFSRTIEITLTNRATMSFRMLLGRKALSQYFMIDPARSFHT